MALLAATIAAAAISAQPADAAAPLPRFAEGTPYPTVRAQLIRMGYEPMRVRKKRPEDSGPCPYPSAFCRAYPEVLSCAIDVPICALLFRRRADGLMIVVQTWKRGESLRDIRYHSVERAKEYHLHDVLISRPPRPPRR